MEHRAGISRRLTTTLLLAARRYRLGANLRVRSFGLSDATALPVLLLRRLGHDVRQGALAGEMGVEGPSLVRLIDQLAAQGFVERVEDPSDRRARLLRLTPAGRKHAAEAEAALDSLRADLFHDISDADLAAALSVLERLAEGLIRLEQSDKP